MRFVLPILLVLMPSLAGAQALLSPRHKSVTVTDGIHCPPGKACDASGLSDLSPIGTRARTTADRAADTLSVLDIASSSTDGPGFRAAVTKSRAIGAANGVGPVALYLPPGAYVPSDGVDLKDTLLDIACGSTLYGNTACGRIRRVDSLAANFNAFPLPGMYVERHFNAQVKDLGDLTKTNGYLRAGAGIQSEVQFGDTAPAIGTPLGLSSGIILGDMAKPDIGVNEVGGLYNHIITRGDKTQRSYSLYTQDNITTSSTVRPTFMGASFRTQNMSAMNPNDASDAAHGLVGASFMTRPLLKADADFSGFPVGTNTNPLAAMVAISGYGGPVTAADDINSGTDSRALLGAYRGLQIGGSNSPYISWNARSKFLYGIDVADYTERGIYIHDPHPAINTAPGASYSITATAGSGPAFVADGFQQVFKTPLSNDPCIAGQTAIDTNYAYICVSTNKWRRSAIFADY